MNVVILSTWKDHYPLDEIKDIFKKASFNPERIIGATPHTKSNPKYISRGEQVKAWLNEHQEYRRFMIIDYAPMDHFDELFDESVVIQPNMNVGFTHKEALRAIEYFNNKH